MSLSPFTFIHFHHPRSFIFISSVSLATVAGKGVRKGGLGLKPPLELDILQKMYYLRKEINCFRILFAC